MASGKYVVLDQIDNIDIDLSEAKVIALQPKSEEVTVTPTTSDQVYTPPAGEYYNKVNVNAVTSAIDENIVPENIAKDVTILGVTGTFESRNMNLYNVQQIINGDTSELIITDSGNNDSLLVGEINDGTYTSLYMVSE